MKGSSVRTKLLIKSARMLWLKFSSLAGRRQNIERPPSPFRGTPRSLGTDGCFIGFAGLTFHVRPRVIGRTVFLVGIHAVRLSVHRFRYGRTPQLLNGIVLRAVFEGASERSLGAGKVLLLERLLPLLHQVL